MQKKEPNKEMNWKSFQSGGEEVHTLTEDEIPSHIHYSTSKLSQDLATNETPANGNVSSLANFGSGLSATHVKSFGPPTNLVDSTSSTTTSTGGSQSHNILQPYLAVNYIIAVQGINPL
mgnify:CR=1 FL=1